MTTPNPYTPGPGPDKPQSNAAGATPDARQQPYRQDQTFQPYTQPYAYAPEQDGARQQPQQEQAYQGAYQQQPYQSAPQQPYGAPYVQQQPAYYYQPTQNRWNVMCIVGFILAFIIPPAGLVLSIIALVQINKSHENSRGLSIAGIVLGALGTLFIVIIIALAAWAIGFSIDYIEQHPEIWDEPGDLSQLDGQICFDDGTCIDTQDLPHDFDWYDALGGTDPTGTADWPDSWRTAQGTVPIEMELVG